MLFDSRVPGSEGMRHDPDGVLAVDGRVCQPTLKFRVDIIAIIVDLFVIGIDKIAIID